MTIHDQVSSIFKEINGDIYTRQEIIDLVIENFPETNPKSIIPSDYCYNLVNKDKTSLTIPLFESLGAGNFKCLEEEYPYSGDILWKNEKVGHWESETIYLDKTRENCKVQCTLGGNELRIISSHIVVLVCFNITQFYSVFR